MKILNDTGVCWKTPGFSEFFSFLPSSRNKALLMGAEAVQYGMAQIAEARSKMAVAEVFRHTY